MGREEPSPEDLPQAAQVNVEVVALSLQPDNWGWTGILPGLGLLSEEFTTAYIRHFDLAHGKTTRLGDTIVIPLQPFCGAMSVAPAEPGTLSASTVSAWAA